MVITGPRVECLHEIRAGKMCLAHRSANDRRCHVCGAVSRTRRVYSPHDETADGLTLRAFFAAANVRRLSWLPPDYSVAG